MTQQFDGSRKSTSESLSSTHQFQKTWEELGQGARVILILGMVLFVYGFFLNGDRLIEIPEVEVPGAQHTQVVQFLEEENIRYDYTDAGTLRVAKSETPKVVAFLDRFVVGFQKPEMKTAIAKTGFGNSLSELTNFRGKASQRSNSRIDDIVRSAEEEVARFEGINAATIVPNRISAERHSQNKFTRINRVSVQLELNEDRKDYGLDSGMVKLIKSHVSVALDVPAVAVQISDTSGRFYDVRNSQPTAADLRNKVNVIEDRVAKFMANILEEGTYRIQVDVGASALPNDPAVFGDNFPKEWPSIDQINDKLIQLTPVTGPLPSDIVTLDALKNAQSRSRWNQIAEDSTRNVAVTVFVDRGPAKAVLDPVDPMQHLNFDPVIPIPAEDNFQSMTRDIARHLEEHLRATFRGDDVTARVVPVNLIGENGQLASSAFSVAEFYGTGAAAGETSQNTTIFFFSVIALLFVVLMFRDGPKDAEKGYSITGFHGGFIERSADNVRTQSDFKSAVSSSEYPAVVTQINHKTFEERLEILRAIVSNQEENLPGSDVLALMIFDLSENRQEIFECLKNEECEVLFQLIDGITGPIGSEEIEDAFAAFELITTGLNQESEIPVLVTTVPTRPEIDEKVIADIRNQNPALADVISKTRGEDSGKVS